MIKSHEKKCQNYFRATTITTNGMEKCRCWIKQEKMLDFDYCEEYLKRVYQTKYYYRNVKKNTFLFSSDLKIDKKIQCKRRSTEKS